MGGSVQSSLKMGNLKYLVIGLKIRPWLCTAYQRCHAAVARWSYIFGRWDYETAG